MDFPWELIKLIGPWATLIIFFVWRDYQRENAHRARIVALEEFQRTVLQDLVLKATTALTQSSECIKWIGHVVERMIRVCPRISGNECDDLRKPE